MGDNQEHIIDIEMVRSMYEEFGYAVHRRCMQLLQNQAAADDMLQEVFLRVIKYSHTFRGGSKLAWLKRIAERLCLDRIRREKPFTEGVSIESDCDHLDHATILYASSEDRSWLMQILSNTPRKVQQVAVLHYLEEMTLEEVAASIGCSSSTVKRRLRKMNRIAKLMKKSLPESRETL